MIDASARDYKDALVEALKFFKCYKDTDVQDFLNNKAIDFEIRDWATTYLLLNRDDFDKGVWYRFNGLNWATAIAPQ